jgi:aspartyl-tRNA(Asn)/glutamyl-tRNA(Gln) amidotransferase subunit B
MNYEAVIGLEVHAQLKTESKIFSSASASFGGSPNSHVNPLCLGMPGVLPVLNAKALKFAVKAALATNCRINLKSRFARKNYFYPDLPKGYQISQYEEPFSEHGWLEVESGETTRKINITRIHMEEDAGKLIHEDSLTSSHVDLNRAGVPLIEIVSEPEISTAEEAVSYLRKLRSILQYIGVCDGNMEEGSLRCDANISIRPVGSDKLGTKAEIKNLNSFKFIQRAIEYEISRQTAMIESGERILQETRLFDSKKGVTFSMRSKEEAHDYRYFPDPDLLPVVLDEKWVKELKESLPELPDAKFNRFIQDYSLTADESALLTSSKDLSDYFEQCLNTYENPKQLSNWITTELLRELNSDEDLKNFPVNPEMLSELLSLADDGIINRNIAKEIFPEMISTGSTAKEIISKKGIQQISDSSEIEALVKEIISSNPDEVARLKGGDEKLLGFFVGQVMKATKGKANPKVVNDMIKKLI